MATHFGPDLKLLYPDLKQSAESDVDIIAIHGLGANPDATWVGEVKDKSGTIVERVNWLRDPHMLPSIIPSASIWTFNYNSNWLGEAPVQRLDILANHLLVLINQKRQTPRERGKPIIFIAHSFGGIVLEAALTPKSSADQYAHIVNASTGIVFLGTPFRGSASAQQALFIADAARVLGYQSQKLLLELLLPSSEELLKLLFDFASTSIKQNLSIVCFFEQLPTTVIRSPGLGWIARRTKTLIVPMPQAVLESHPNIGLGTEHTSMNKFCGPDDNNYKLVSGQIHKLVKSSAETLQKKSRHHTKSGPIIVIPYFQNPDFVGRADILERVDSQLATKNNSPKTVALYGLGGVGKSQIAIAYSYIVREKLPDLSIFWVHAASRARFENSYLEIAKEAGLSISTEQASESMQIVKRWLESEKSLPWLLVVDNADDITLFPINRNHGEDLSNCIPKSLKGSILYTSRDKQVCLNMVGARSIVEVNKMKSEDCKRLLSKTLSDEKYSSGDALRLVEVLHNFPLALTQAAADIEYNSTSISDYLDLFESDDISQAELLDLDFTTVGRDDVPNALTKTWKISFDQIQKNQHLAAQLLSVMAFFDKQDIPKELLPHEGHSRVEFEKALGTLQAFSMITADNTVNGYNMHRLVQLSIVKWLHDSSKDEKFVKGSLCVLSNSWPSCEFKDWPICARYLPHAESVLRHAQQRKFKMKEMVCVLNWSGCYLQTQGNYDMGEDYGLKAVHLGNEILGTEHHDTLSSMNNLAATYRNQGHWNKAEELQVQVMEATKKVLGSEHPDTMSSMGNLATIYMNQGHWNKAEELQVQVMEATKRVLGSEHPDTLSSMSNLASTYMNQGHWNKAEELEVQVMEARKRVLGSEHPDTLRSMGNLAATYRNQGHWNKAEELQVQVTEARERVLGSEHPDTLTSMGNLATIYRDQGHWNKAEELQVQVMEARNRVLGSEHPDTLLSMWNLSHMLKEQDKDHEAIDLLQKVVDLHYKILGPEHPRTKQSAGTLEKWTAVGTGSNNV